MLFFAHSRMRVNFRFHHFSGRRNRTDCRDDIFSRGSAIAVNKVRIF
jgi:hypothetical protein